LTANDFKSYKKISNLVKETVSSCIFTNFETEFSNFFINIVKNKSSIFSLIKKIQEFDLLCRQISSQLHRKSERNSSFALIRNEILRKTDHVFVSQQKIIWVWLLELFHDCSSSNHWNRNKILKLIQHHFIWNEIADDIHVYITTCLICQGKAIHHHKSYKQLESLSMSKNMWNSSFKKISLDWVTELSFSLKNNQNYNSILIIICHITKYTLFISTQDDTTAADFAELFFEHVECQFDFSRSIVTDKDFQIISDFWQEVCKIQMIK